MAKEIYIPDFITIKELAEKLDVKPSQIVSWLFMEGYMETLESKIVFETAKKIENRCDVLLKRIEKVTYYENRKLKIVEQGGNYTVYDKKYGNIYRDKTKECVDDLILSMLYKKPF